MTFARPLKLFTLSITLHVSTYMYTISYTSCLLFLPTHYSIIIRHPKRGHPPLLALPSGRLPASASPDPPA